MEKNSDKKRDPRERFIDLANKRVTKTIRDLRLVGNLANKNVYKYEDADVKKILKALSRELAAVKARFEGDNKDNSAIFSL